MPHRNVLLLPLVLADELIHENHNALLEGHEGITRTKVRLLQSYFWPNMEEKITQHVTACQRCQVRRTTDRSRPPLLIFSTLLVFVAKKDCLFNCLIKCN